MRDTVLKESRNSRSIIAPIDLKSRVSSLDDLLDLFIAGFECDFGPLNPAGVQVMGDDLNKANLLSDETAALYPGLPENPVPDDVLAAIAPELAKIKKLGNCGFSSVYSYTGTGLVGKDNKKSYTFTKKPLAVIIAEDGWSNVVIHGQTSTYARGANAGRTATVEWTNRTVSWWTDYGESYSWTGFNASGATYRVLALLDFSS